MNTELVAQVKQAEEAVRKRVEAAKSEAEQLVETARAEAMEQYDAAYDLTHKQLIEGTFKAERDSAAAMEKEIQDGRQKIAATMEYAQKNVEAALKIVIGELVAK
ncbi:MAG TPA: hypothetical protein PK629_03085 [Oscillospiraceae bacterium]|nr:hypothetical protein [Oscillospiraceae bacterium]HPK34805.1 hypothetical protein [Oscillospiraceae bacterium]HPR75855.1 hypothetical protein [Oscillospiraceae bacterium]